MATDRPDLSDFVQDDPQALAHGLKERWMSETSIGELLAAACFCDVPMPVGLRAAALVARAALRVAIKGDPRPRHAIEVAEMVAAGTAEPHHARAARRVAERAAKGADRLAQLEDAEDDGLSPAACAADAAACVAAMAEDWYTAAADAGSVGCDAAMAMRGDEAALEEMRAIARALWPWVEQFFLNRTAGR